MLVKRKRNSFCRSLPRKTNNYQREVLKTLTEFPPPPSPPVNIFELNNNKYDRKIQQTSKSNGKPPKTRTNFFSEHFSLTNSTRKIRTRSSFSKGNVSRRIKTKCCSRRKNFPFSLVTGKTYKGSRNLGNSERIKNSLVKDTNPGKITLNTLLKENRKFL